MSWIEVETKVKLDKNEISQIKKKILEIAKFDFSKIKKDYYFALKTKGYPKKAFRLRKNGKDFEVNFKKRIENLDNPEIAVKEEFEFKIKDPENFIELMKDLGFIEFIEKEKKSILYRYKDDNKLGIELNYVKNLGYFLELEYLCQKKDVDYAKKIIYEALKKLDIEKSKIDNTGYTKMLFLRGIRNKKYFI